MVVVIAINTDIGAILKKNVIFLKIVIQKLTWLDQNRLYPIFIRFKYIFDFPIT